MVYWMSIFNVNVNMKKTALYTLQNLCLSAKLWYKIILFVICNFFFVIWKFVIKVDRSTLASYPLQKLIRSKIDGFDCQD